MFLRFTILAAGLLCGGAAIAVAGPGYLQVVGPAPLRFHAPDAPAGKSRLPPLPADMPVPAVLTPPAAMNPDNAEATTKAGGDRPGGAGLTTSEGAPLTTDMLVEIFRSRFAEEHRRGDRVIVPYGFVAPRAEPRASSSAAYETK